MSAPLITVTVDVVVAVPDGVPTAEAAQIVIGYLGRASRQVDLLVGDQVVHVVSIEDAAG